MRAIKYFIFAAAVFIYFSGCDVLQQVANVQKPTASLKNVGISDISLQSATLLFDVEVQNPYPVTLPLLNMDYAVESSGNNLFNGKADLQNTSIPAKDKKTVSLPAKVSYLDLIKAFKGISPGSKIPYKADVGLSVDASSLGQIRLPLNKTGELAVPTIPKAGDLKNIILEQVGKQ